MAKKMGSSKKTGGKKGASIYLTQEPPKSRSASVRYNLVERSFRRGHSVRGRDQSLPRIADDFLDCAKKGRRQEMLIA